ncbi:MAG: hypothetical protein WAV21_00650 [Minisyncoccia bacterium]
MSPHPKRKSKVSISADTKRSLVTGTLLGLAIFAALCAFGASGLFSVTYDRSEAFVEAAAREIAKPTPPTLDKAAYNKKMLQLAQFVQATSTSSTTPAITPVFTATTTVSVPGKLWPAKTVYPNVGAILPFKRIVSYYGNFYSKGMGVLGEYSTEEMLSKLKAEKAVWEAADPTTPVVPAIHYIAVTAQASAGNDGKYRLRMPDSQIDHAIELAKQIDGIVFLDIQVGLSDVQTEIPLLKKYLAMPQVHLGLDPEFSMKTGVKPGRVIGTMDATDINYAAQYLATLVKENNLPPKIIVLHRFTEEMLTGYKQMRPLPEVQIVVDMDGWGFGAKKINTYKQVVYSEPIQFTGFKLFYKNDLKAPSTRLLTPAEILSLIPQPSYIQYQ